MILLSHARVFEWHKRFTGGLKEVKDDEIPDRPVIARTQGIVGGLLTLRLKADVLAFS